MNQHTGAMFEHEPRRFEIDDDTVSLVFLALRPAGGRTKASVAVPRRITR